MEQDKILAHQASLNTKPSLLPPPVGNPPPVISYPFQITLASLGTEDAADSVSIASNSVLATYTALYRHAQLKHLKATIHPTYMAPKYPTSVALVWVPANSTATSTQVLDTYGGLHFCIGGSVNSVKPIDVEANLTNLNPIIKASTTFTDTPKLLYYSKAQATAPTSPTCYLTIQGQIELSSPLLQASS
ncbi:virion protein [Desmodium yellow mottle virus]|uniref:Capsid protein n=1 Tax=Desmodium yellow mottle virus TaxID=70821 RepID=O89511_9VIRU|nr:virion protein [Desmodium yellow mottle virus]AAC25013.1 virion protein [Desmodium yellow mottle virus]1DDL_A Chain A, DESMODIUM YELLOW MOTTLE VIRUS [Desmodium yellow mottle virus]1DDL_B Chain B, DESMODIUM YELLOW MOTTLE VIRUS [Desmodium yellow mottle virus]1DDL_C Chain C, DESMODIUM YELLOW MOTTLE VIRUS [Desmodium yellow mottle virus]